ncbi:Uncharacterised protein [[Clostridium] sordellii]|uniref:hypothetical protein n=1 Tax=Paraclostridium sordellii TaxID=1505 RepID=UPI0005DE71A0|nr:hypothetical protein [Paeniclostridium sordellii]CEQ10659.1 Uncharacterised protein [[Clostridium] sordellii] [Paeniclostridium sordellii]
MKIIKKYDSSKKQTDLGNGITIVPPNLTEEENMKALENLGTIMVKAWQSLSPEKMEQFLADREAKKAKKEAEVF